VRPEREELIEDIDLDEPDPGAYDRLCDDNDIQEKKDQEKQDE
jgi:hypothetical protein